MADPQDPFAIQARPVVAAAPDAVASTQNVLGLPTGVTGGNPANASQVIDPTQNVAPPTPDKALSDARLAREDKTSFSDYGSAMWDEDNLTSGIVRHIVGQQMTPDANYTPFAPDEWKGLTEGVLPEFHKEFYGAQSAAQALYIKGLLLDKQENLSKLGDLGWKGNVGRLTVGLLDPANLAVGEVGGWAAKGVKTFRGVQALRAIKAADTAPGAISAAEAAVGASSSAAEASGGLTSIAAGLAAAGGSNAALEKLHASTNFDDESNGQLAISFLMGGLMAAPFIGAGARASSRLATTSGRELEALAALRRDYEGSHLTPEEHTNLQDVADAHQTVQRFDEGGLKAPEPQEVEAAMGKLNGEVQQPESFGFKEAFGSLKDGGVSEDFYNQAFAALRDGKDTVAGIKDPLLARHKEAFDRGEITSAADLRASEQSSFLPGSVGAAQHLGIDSIATDTTQLARARLDIFKVLNGSSNPEIQKLAFDLVKDPIGISNHYAQGRTASEIKSDLRRTTAGNFHAELRTALDEAVKTRNVPYFKRSAFEKDFAALVTAHTRGDATALTDNPDIASSISRGSAGMRKMYDTLLDEAKKAGVKGADTVKPGDMYVNRVWSHNRIRDAIETHGWAHVSQALADAIKVPGMVGDRDKAHSFLNAVMKLEYSPALQDVHLVARDMETLKAELKHYGLNDTDVHAIADTMFETHAKLGGAEPDAGRQGNLKYRFDIDENMKSHSAAGDFKISDLFENDSRALADVYSNSMAGHIGMAQKGIYSKADWAARLAKVDEFHATNLSGSQDALEHNRHKTLLQDIYNHITGAPMSTQDYSTLNRYAGAFRGLVRSMTLGQLGIAAAFEMKQAWAGSSMRAIFAHSPTLTGLLESMKTGRIPDREFARNVEQMSGFGFEKAASHAREREISEGFYDKALGNFENFANKASHVVDHISGNASFTSITRQWTAMAMMQHHYDLATGRKALTESKGTRLVHQGVDRDMQASVLDHLKQYTEASPSNGLIQRVKYEDWSRQNPETYSLYQGMLNREVRDAIQDHDIGETMPFMHSTLGKVFSELKTFMFVAHAKNFLKNASYHDKQTFNLAMLSFVGESLGYMVQTVANNAHDPEQLSKKLAIDQIARAAFFRAGALGILPLLLDTGYGVATGGESLVQPGTTANTDNRSMLLTPSFMKAKAIPNALMTLGGLALPNGAVTTQKEMKDMLGLIPGSNTYLLRNLIDYTSGLQPKVDPAHPMSR